MQTSHDHIRDWLVGDYAAGFVTPIEHDVLAHGLDESTIRTIGEEAEAPWLLAWRLMALARFQSMTEPRWSSVITRPLDYQAMSYYAAPKQTPRTPARSTPGFSRDTYSRSLGIPLQERAALAGVAVDAVIDSVSVATTFKAKLARARHHLLLLLRGGSRAPRAGPEVPRHRSSRPPTTSSRR